VSRTFTSFFSKLHRIDRLPAPLRINFDPWGEVIAESIEDVKRPAANKILHHLLAQNLRALPTISGLIFWGVLESGFQR